MALNLFQGGRMGVRIVLLLSTKLYVHLAKDTLPPVTEPETPSSIHSLAQSPGLTTLVLQTPSLCLPETAASSSLLVQFAR